MKAKNPSRNSLLSVRSIPLFLRFVLPLAIALTVLAYAIVPLVDSLTLRWFVRDLDTRSNLLASTLRDPLLEAMSASDTARIASLFNTAVQDQRLYAMALCDPRQRMLVKTELYPAAFGCEPLAGRDPVQDQVIALPQGSLHVASIPLSIPGETARGSLIVVHDMSFIERRSEDTRLYIILLFAVLGVITALITMFVAHLSWRGWIQGVRAMLRGEGVLRPFERSRPDVEPLVNDLRSLLRRIDEDRRQRDEMVQRWTPEGLRLLLREHLLGDEVIVVSNREPYIHERVGDAVKVRRPASGLVTAVEPVMRACSGTWIAHGSGSADREVSDARDCVGVPPEQPSYTLKRIWLTEKEEAGYYYGFANEGLWPLCHIAHVRPVFRASDWLQYQRVNQRFADAVVELARTEDPVVLVHDYHFALVPRLIRQRLPQATIITFWHIPWPNPESFGICPWRDEILDGLLGSTIIGFHTPYHCKNFIETIDRYIESRIEHEHSLIHYRQGVTQVQDYPISIHWPTTEALSWPSIDECRAQLRERLGVSPQHRIALGVDRLDYTKGILERLFAIEQFLISYPDWLGRFTFVQIAAPSRATLEEYVDFDKRVRATAERINARFAHAAHPPIELLIEHHDSASVTRHYRGCDVCVVTSLHDGMNLVAKEFVAARDDEQGVLILSQFAGAARELQEALVVNPYYIEQVADAMQQALTMPEVEQRERMHSLREQVREHNVYRWAGRMLHDASRLRQRERISARIDAHSREPERARDLLERNTRATR